MTPPVQYKGADLDPARGPGLGCFWIQVVAFAIFVVLTPLSVGMGAPSWLSAVLLFITLGLLFFAGQTVIFLLRLVAADRREGRRRPLASGTRTVGELEDERRAREAGDAQAAEVDARGSAEDVGEAAAAAPGADGGPPADEDVGDR